MWGGGGGGGGGRGVVLTVCRGQSVRILRVNKVLGCLILCVFQRFTDLCNMTSCSEVCAKQHLVFTLTNDVDPT